MTRTAADAMRQLICLLNEAATAHADLQNAAVLPLSRGMTQQHVDKVADVVARSGRGVLKPYDKKPNCVLFVPKEPVDDPGEFTHLVDTLLKDLEEKYGFEPFYSHAWKIIGVPH